MIIDFTIALLYMVLSWGIEEVWLNSLHLFSTIVSLS